MKATSHQTVIYAGDGLGRPCFEFIRGFAYQPHGCDGIFAFPNTEFRLTRQEAAEITMRAKVLDIQLQFIASEDNREYGQATSGGLLSHDQGPCSQDFTPNSLTRLQAPSTNSYN